MWNHIKDIQPICGETVEIQHKQKVLECFVTETTVYNSSDNIIVKVKDIELWRYPKKEAKESRI